MIWLDPDQEEFPPTQLADEDGLLAVGGDLSTTRLMCAYRQGIFPWYNEGEPILWWTLDPRCVLFPEKLYVSDSMRLFLRKTSFEFRFNTAFELVMQKCQRTKRVGQDGTWIQQEMIDAYLQLQKNGNAISGECWENGELVGGLYGVWIKGVFFGESMFHLKTNASKFAFINTVEHLKSMGLELIDCQQATQHLISMGAELIPRHHFEDLLRDFVGK
jgi:leucyl/phenylalanyl-tRNA--protein transferase